jgi:hypothetical protein
MAEGGTGGKKIERLSKGDSTRTARHADVMNEIIDRVNSFLGMTVTPKGKGKFIFSESNIVLDASKMGGVPDPPATGTYVLGAIDSVVQWMATDLCGCDQGTIDGGTA